MGPLVTIFKGFVPKKLAQLTLTLFKLKAVSITISELFMLTFLFTFKKSELLVTSKAS